MIFFTRDGNHVKAIVRSVIPLLDSSREFYFYWDCGNPVYAGLLATQLEETMHKTLEKIREQEYERGYKDGHAKRRKKDFFRLGWFLR